MFRILIQNPRRVDSFVACYGGFTETIDQAAVYDSEVEAETAASNLLLHLHADDVATPVPAAKRITLVDFDEDCWQALYVGGKLVCHDMLITVEDFVKYAAPHLDFRSCLVAYVDELADDEIPERLSDLRLKPRGS